MQNVATKRELVGFIQIQVGSLNVNVPIKSREPAIIGAPLAELEKEGSAVSIVIYGDTKSTEVEQAVTETAKEALKYLQQKLLN